MITLFIDRTSSSPFYHLTSEDIEELKKLVVLMRRKKSILSFRSRLKTSSGVTAAERSPMQ